MAYLTTTQPRLTTGLTITRHTLSFCVTASSHKRCRNLHLLSIGYDYCPHLRPRLTLGGPWAFDGHVSRMALATHTCIISPVQSTAPLGTASARTRCSSTTLCYNLHHPMSSFSFLKGHLLAEGHYLSFIFLKGHLLAFGQE